VLSKPGFFNQVLAWGTRFQGIFIKPVDDLLGSSCSRFLSPLLRGRHIKPLAPVPLHRQVPTLNTAPGAASQKVAFFVGCLIDKIFPQVGEAVLKVLDHHGVGVYLPPNQGCCGIPALSSGDTESFDRLVRHNLELFGSEPFDKLITACATCASTIKKMWLRWRRISGRPRADRRPVAGSWTSRVSGGLGASRPRQKGSGPGSCPSRLCLKKSLGSGPTRSRSGTTGAMT
jgi:hypothetical protein